MNWTISEQYNGMMLRDYLFDVLQFSKRLIIRAKSADGKIVVNGEKKTVRYILKAGDLLEITLPPEEKSDFIKVENIPLNIMYEDDYFIVIHKEAGMLTIPSILDPTGTVANGLLYYYEQNNIPYTVHVVTRLDRDTSGLVLIAKHQYSHSLFSAMQRSNKIKRKYVAVVHGIMNVKSGKIDAPIGRKTGSIIERAVTTEGKTAITHYKVIQETSNCTLIEIELETGRTHQIRVHFSHVNHPLLGDDLYGGKKELITRQALHCAELSFTHPFTKEVMTFSCDPPQEMTNIIKQEQSLI